MIEQNKGEANMAGSERGGGGIAAKSHDAAEQLKHAVTDQVEQVREKAESAQEHAAERFRRVASELKNVGETLRTDDKMASAVADRASRSVESIASYVASTDLRGFMRDTEQLARRQPALFFGGAFLVGLALGRFMKNAPPESPTAGAKIQHAAPPPRMSPRQETPVATDAGQQRYRANVDATFGRDVPRPDTIPESNGVHRANRGPVA